MAKITTTEFRKGMFIEFKGEPHNIIEFQHVNPGKGSAFIRTRLKSLRSGKVQDFTFKSGETVEELYINTREMQYLYKEREAFLFMDNYTFEQFELTKEILGELSAYLKENETYQIMIFQDKAVGLRFPKKVLLKVIDTEDATKGNTVSGATKPAKLETGIVVQVPLFIKVGDSISVDPESGEYVERNNL